MPLHLCGWNGSWFLVAVALALRIGLRVRVGGDWFLRFNYLRIYRERGSSHAARQRPRLHAGLADFQLEYDVFGANLFGGLFLNPGRECGARRLPRPWLALAVAVPYTVIVVGMGYSRRGSRSRASPCRVW